MQTYNMISQIYNNINAPIPILDNLPDDIHGIICEYLDKNHEYAGWILIKPKRVLVSAAAERGSK